MISLGQILKVTSSSRVHIHRAGLHTQALQPRRNLGPKPNQLVWLITGTSSGLGKRLVTSALSRGDRVIATARSLPKLKKVYQESENLRLLQLDVTTGFENIKPVIEDAVSCWGKVDVLVNNAGTGLLGLVEESGTDMIRRQFETNVYGVVDTTNAILPHMRTRKQGTIVTVGSRSVWRSETPGLGTYAASKAAIHALTASMSTELAPFGIRTLLLSPGAFRTEGIYSVPFNTLRPIPEYDEFRKTCIERFAAVPGNEPGDPEKATETVVDVVRGEGVAKGKPWPWCLLLGNDAERDLNSRWRQHEDVRKQWSHVTRSVWFDGIADQSPHSVVTVPSPV